MLVSINSLDLIYNGIKHMEPKGVRYVLSRSHREIYRTIKQCRRVRAAALFLARFDSNFNRFITMMRPLMCNNVR